MPLYESTFVVRQDVSPQEVEKIADNFEKIINDNGGKIIKKESWGLLNLAYKINKNRKGHYILLGIEANNDTLSELNRQYKLSEDVIRSLTVRVNKIDEKPSQMIASNDDNQKGGE